VTYGSIKTSKAKAKAVKGMIDKMITTAKKGTDASYRQILGDMMSDVNVAKALVADSKDRFASRTSGYTRMVSIGVREGDSTEMVALSFVDAPVLRGEVVKKNASKTKKGSTSTKEAEAKGVKKSKKVSKK